MSFFRKSRVACLALLVTAPALAAPELTWDKPPPRAVSPSTPPASRGFQAALRTGASMPWGKASAEAGDEFTARSGWQVPLIIDAGFKLSKPVFLGIYLGAAYGASGGGPLVEELCDTEGFDCSVQAYQFGVQGQYHFGASEAINPWIGYGVGYEIMQQSIEGGGYSETQTSSGFTYMKASIGADVRSTFGIGPFLEVSAGRFDTAQTDVDDTLVHEGPVDESEWHGYLTFGVRLVLLP